MRMPAIVLIFALLAAAPVVAAPAPDGRLDKPFTMTTGDYLAMRIESILQLKAVATFDAPVMVDYDHKKKKLLFVIFGSQVTADGAKSSIEDFRAKVLPKLGGIFASEETRLRPEDVMIEYLNRGSMKEILSFENNQYIMLPDHVEATANPVRK